MQQLNVEQPPCFIHVTGTQRDKYIEFEFSIGDPELAVSAASSSSAPPRRQPGRPTAPLPPLQRTASIGRAAIWSRPSSRAAFQAATMRAMSMPMCAGWRRYAGPVSSSGSTPTNGASPMIWSAVPPPMTPAETVRPAFASFPRSI